MGYDLILENGTVVLPWGERETDIAVKNGKIAAIGGNLGKAEERFNAKGLHVLPGVIDPHVHFRDGGQGGIEGVEDMHSGSLGAVLGGVTACFDMPNTNPAGVDVASLQAKHDYIPGHSWCDIGIFAGATMDNLDETGMLETLPGVCAMKVFAGSSTGNLLVADDVSIERLMRSGRRRVSFHSEDEERLQERKAEFEQGGPYSDHYVWRDVECAFKGTRRITAIAERTGRPAHILHVSTAEEFEFLREHKDLVGCEVLVNHLLQCAPDVYERLGGYGVMNPPLREKRHMDAAWAAIADGTVDNIGSDHAPHLRANKEKPWPAVAAGLTGVQTTLPLMLTKVNEGRLSLLRLAQLMSEGPARIYGAVGKGRIVAGNDADFSVVDLKARRTIENKWIASQCGWTPFDGTGCVGWPMATIIRGQVVMYEGQVTGEPVGRAVNFRS